MMNKQTFVSFALITIALFFSGCGSSPTARLYILNTIDRENAAMPALTAAHHNVAVKVGPVSIPDTLDQPQIITRLGQNSLLADEFNRWSGDFQEDIQRIIGENISILLPTNQVMLSQEVNLLPFDYQVVVNIREFDGALAGVVTLNADWTVSGKGKEKAVTAKKSVLQENTVGTDYSAYVAAQSRLLAKLSQEITEEIKRQLK